MFSYSGKPKVKSEKMGRTCNVLTVRLALPAAALFTAVILMSSGCGQTGGSSTPVPGEDPSLNYTIYPDTSAAPVMRFYWGPAKQTTVPPTLSETGIYGIWEGGSGGGAFKTGREPATEIELRLSSTRDAVYSCTKGTVVYVNAGSPNAYGQPVGTVSVRYGRSYIAKYLHVTDIPATITAGVSVEQGALLGYTEKMGASAGFWEVELDFIKDSTKIRAIPPVGYFDADSTAVFNSMLALTGETAWALPLTAATTEGWVSYVGTHEMWADPAKCGVKNTSAYEGLEAFLAAFGLSWVLE